LQLATLRLALPQIRILQTYKFANLHFANLQLANSIYHTFVSTLATYFAF
jgi:hypothetical protein